MNAVTITSQLIDYTVAQSGAEERHYLGMSHIAECPRRLYDMMTSPAKPWPLESHLRCYAGYLWERDVKARLAILRLYVPGSERELIAAFDSRFQGHTDGEIIGDQHDARFLLEIKSTNPDKFSRIFTERRLPTENYHQVQIYLRHGGYPKAYVVYVCRDTGELYTLEVLPNPHLQDILDAKARRVLAAVDSSQPPRCDCGRCR